MEDPSSRLAKETHVVEKLVNNPQCLQEGRRSPSGNTESGEDELDDEQDLSAPLRAFEVVTMNRLVMVVSKVHLS